MAKRRLAIIGNGMGTCRLLEELVNRAAHMFFEITVFGEEAGGAYNRIMLGKVLAGEDPEAIVTRTPRWYERHGIRLVDRTCVTRLDTRGKTIETRDGQQRRYDMVVFATGSEAIVPPLAGLRDDEGMLKPGAFAYRTVADCLRIREYARLGTSAVVVGGGLLGLEAAKVLADRGLHVTVVHMAPTLMDAQLDRTGGAMLGRQMEQAGIFVRAGRTVTSAYGDGRIEGVILDDGAPLPADLVVLACGVRPRVDVARASGVPVNRGIVVNDALATEVPGVLAFGECAEHRGRTYGIVTPVWEQADALAGVLAGAHPPVRYTGSKVYTRLKVAGMEVASMGRLEPELDSDEVVQVIEERKLAYRKMIVRDGRLLGAMLVGNATAAAGLLQMFDRNDPMPVDPLEALCSRREEMPPAERVVCNCNKVTEGTICDAIAAGACSVEAIGDATRAGTGCGSCRTELKRLVGATKRPVPMLEAVS